MREGKLIRLLGSRQLKTCTRARSLTVAALFVLTFAAVSRADNWPQWRGPLGTSVADDAKLPIVWNAERGIAWKAELPAWGTSTPCIWQNAIFVTSHTEDDKLLLLRLNKQSGKVEWTKTVGKGEAGQTPLQGKAAEHKQKFHDLHNLASPSPVTNGEVVIVHFGNGLLAAYDFEGNERWSRNLQDDHGGYTIWWGHANSPVLYGNLVISVCMQDSLAKVADKPVESYLVAHDIRNGKERWKTLRMTEAKAEECDSYTTPLVVEVEGKPQLVVMGGNQLDAYDPETGKQIWYLPGLVGGRTVTGPTSAHGLIYATRGMKGAMVAVRPGQGKLDRTAIVWRHEEGTPDTPTPVVWNDLLFIVTDNGIARCFDAHNGSLMWSERLKGDYKASPVAAGNRVYFLNTQGLCTVVAASPRFNRLAENQIDDETLASPAISDGRLYIRGRKSLHCLAKL